MEESSKKKLIALFIIIFFGVIVIMFADFIVPTVTSTPIRFEIIEPNVDPNLP